MEVSGSLPIQLYLNYAFLVRLRSYFLQAVFVGGFCRESKKKKAYPPPQRNWEVFFQSPVQPCAHPNLLPEGSHCLALNLLRQ